MSLARRAELRVEWRRVPPETIKVVAVRVLARKEFSHVLTQLDIQGLAIIDTLAIQFSPGFNVITGETGAGKSILIKALGLLLGAKASSEAVRHGREAASVSGVFDAPKGHKCAEVLKKYEIPFEKDEAGFQVLVRRSINSKGRSLAWINDLPVTMGVLKEFAASLIDIFAQHENQRILDASQHTTYLDQFIKDKSVLADFKAKFEICTARLHAVAGRVQEFLAKRRDADYLSFRCEELRKFAPSCEDYEDVQALCQRAGNQLSLLNGLEQAQTCIDQGVEGEPLGRAVWEASRLLGRVGELAPDLKALSDEAAQIASRLDDLSYGIGRAVSSLEVDENDLEQAQDRLSGYQDLFRKLAVHDIDELLAERGRLESELAFIESAAAEVHGMLDELVSSCVDLQESARKLSKARLKAREVVKKRIETELHELAMPGASIDVEFLPAARHLPALELGLFGETALSLWTEACDILSGIGEHGFEKAQLLLSSNPGEPLYPVQKIASGGEVSRIMLALKKGLAAGADTCILVFDEIDSGISGRVADVVGRKMQELSNAFQVICISHLAQVAAYADSHFLVHKFGKDKRTESTIIRLATGESEQEIARLLSGDEVTTSSLANARALLRKARTKEKELANMR